ncbi:unnamed protein product [Toxocara canis]|nr:unnamed protein product [Toxocara canis]
MVVRVSIACRDCTFSAYGISMGPFPCTITGQKVYLRGLYYKDIGSNEMSQLTEYKKQMADYNKLMDAYYKQPWYETINITLPELPRRPSFCGDNTTVIYKIGECRVLGAEVFIKNIPVRTLSTVEQQQLYTFYKQAEAHANYFEKQMQQGYFANFYNNVLGFDQKNTAPKATVAPPPPDPVAPDVCYTI